MNTKLIISQEPTKIRVGDHFFYIDTLCRKSADAKLISLLNEEVQVVRQCWVSLSAGAPYLFGL